MYSFVMAKRICFFLVVLMFGCTGKIDDPTNPNGGPSLQPRTPWATCDRDEGIQPGETKLLRLSDQEYDNAVVTIFGQGAKASVAETTVANGIVSGPVVSELQTVAQNVATFVKANIGSLVSCSPGAECATEFIQTYGRLLYRGPVSDAELALLQGVYETGSSLYDFETGIEMVTETMLQSPRFLYRFEIDPGAATAENVVRLSGYEIATRLAFFLTGNTPSKELLDAAEAGELDTTEGVDQWARTLLEDGGSVEDITISFFNDWLHMELLDDLKQDGEKTEEYAKFDASVTPELFRRETEEFIRYVLTQDDGTFQTLMTANYSVMNSELADYYGLSMSGDGWNKIERDDLHSGLMTQGSFTVTRAKLFETHPIHRGMFVAGDMLCTATTADIPEGIEPPDPDPTKTTRERLSEHRANPDCAVCHNSMDPPGFAFENFDAYGVVRTEENNLPVDASGTLIGTDVDGDFQNAKEMLVKLGDSQQAQRCFVSRWFSFAYGRPGVSKDGCTLDTLYNEFKAGEFRIQDLIVALTKTDAFLYRRTGDDQ